MYILLGDHKAGMTIYRCKVVKMDASWFMEFVGFVRENWLWCVAAIGILLCLHHFIGSSDEKQIERSEPSSCSSSTGNSCSTTVNPVINVVPNYSVSDQSLRADLNPSDRLYFDRAVSNSQQFVDFGTHFSYRNPGSANELKAKASALQKSVAINDPSCLSEKSFEQCLAAYRMSVEIANALHEARVNLQNTCASVSKANRTQPSYKTLVNLEKDLYKREQVQNHASAIARNYIGATFGNRGKRWYQENRRRAIDKKANAR